MVLVGKGHLFYRSDFARTSISLRSLTRRSLLCLMAVNPDSILYPSTGVQMSDEPSYVYPRSAAGGGAFVHMATNMAIEDSRWKTRHRWIELQIDERDVFDFEKWKTASTQGATWYDPAAGNTADPFSRGEAGIVESASGRMFRLTPGIRSFRCQLLPGPQARKSMRMAWMTQAENYVIRTDRASLTQIYDGRGTITTSEGFNRNDPTNSRLPNFAGPSVFTDRIWIVNGAREIIAGDHLHRNDLTGATDLLRTEDQSYDINDVSFPPPGAFGDVVGLHLYTTSRGGALSSQSEVMAGCADPAIWGVSAGIPRELWRQSQMRRVVNDESGPVGPYAVITARNEYLFRSPAGIESIKTFDAQTGLPANALIDLGSEIRPLLNYDYPDLLFFCSAARFKQRQRVVCTVDPQVKYTRRWHNAFVAANLNYTGTRTPGQFIWEGLQTLPERMGRPVQFIEGTGGRVFCITDKSDGTKGLAEWTTEDGPDVLADGTAVPQRWRFITRRLTTAGEFRASIFSAVYLWLTGIGDVEVDINCRIDDGDLQRVGTYTQTECCCKWALDNPIKFELPNKGKTLQLIIDGTGTVSKIDVALNATQASTASDEAGICREIPTNPMFVYA